MVGRRSPQRRRRSTGCRRPVWSTSAATTLGAVSLRRPHDHRRRRLTIGTSQQAAHLAAHVPNGSYCGSVVPNAVPCDALLSSASARSADGKVIVGLAWNGCNFARAFRWEESTGMVDLGIDGSGPIEPRQRRVRQRKCRARMAGACDGLSAGRALGRRAADDLHRRRLSLRRRGVGCEYRWHS